MLDRVANFQKIVKDHYFPARPPQDLAPDLLTLPKPGIPKLHSIVTTPVFLPDRRLLTTNGYDIGSNILVRLKGLDGVRSDMSRDEALGLIRNELLGEFPFSDDASIAHAIAMFLEPPVRPMINGPTPIRLIDAPGEGSGKGLLADIACMIATGRTAIAIALPDSEDEIDKRITALLLEGEPFILFDNVEVLKSRSLAGALTTTMWGGRFLSKTKMLKLPNQSFWVATGNNVELSNEISRRTVSIRLDAKVERPGERQDFIHDDLPMWVDENRTDLVSACMSLVQLWIDKGCPQGKKKLGRFESWSRIIGGILDAIGVQGFLDDRERVNVDSNKENREWLAFCEKWYERYAQLPVTSGELFKDVISPNKLLLDVWAGRGDLSATQRIGHALGRNRDRVFGQWVIRASGRDGDTKNQSYRLESKKTPETSQKNSKTPEGETACETMVYDAETGVSGVSGVSYSSHENRVLNDSDALSNDNDAALNDNSGQRVWEKHPKTAETPYHAVNSNTYDGVFSSDNLTKTPAERKTPAEQPVDFTSQILEPDDDISLMIGTPKWAAPVERNNPKSQDEEILPHPGKKKRNPQMRDIVGAQFGISGRSVQKAAKVSKFAPHLSDKMRDGSISLEKAYQEARRIEQMYKSYPIPMEELEGFEE